MEVNNKAVEILEKIFSNVNNWLAFAEAKNAAIIAFNIAVIAALLSGSDVLGKTIIFYFLNVIIVLSTAFALLSFIPNLGNDKSASSQIDEQDNLLLFSHIAKYSKEQYLIAVYRVYFNLTRQENDLSKIELDYADEITYNAGITVNKYRCFKRALYIDFVGILGILILIIIA